MITMTAPAHPHAVVPCAEPRLLRHLHDLARDGGLVTGLRALCSALARDGVPFGPAGHAVLPAEATAAGPAQRLLTVDLGADAVYAVKATEYEPAPVAWSLGVSWLRLGVSRWLLRQATEHVTHRSAGTESLLQQQMVKGMIADALTEQLAAEALLDGRTDPAVVTEANARIQDADRILLRLLGASGFQSGPASHTCWVSELLADAYIGYEPAEDAS